MLFCKGKRYNFLLNLLMPRDEISFLLKNKYALSLAPPKEGKAKNKESQPKHQEAPEVKF